MFKVKIICFGVRDYEVPVFKEIASQFNVEFVLRSEYIDGKNYLIARGFETIILRANCNLNDISIGILAENGLKYLLTRTIGYNHIPLEACTKHGVKVAFAKGYSPSSIAELGLSLAINIIRNIPEAIGNSSKIDFRLNESMFGREINGRTVGILGCGKVGKVSANLYHAFGAKVIGYDHYENAENITNIEYRTFDEVISESDILSIHMSYHKGINDHIVGRDEISRMKDRAIIINTARGELLDTIALIDGVKSGKLLGAGLDVLEDENKYFFRRLVEDDMSQTMTQLIRLYPRVIITPHISSSTDAAVFDSMKITMENLKELQLKGVCKNSLV